MEKLVLSNRFLQPFPCWLEEMLTPNFKSSPFSVAASPSSRSEGHTSPRYHKSCTLFIHAAAFCWGHLHVWEKGLLQTWSISGEVCWDSQAWQINFELKNPPNSCVCNNPISFQRQLPGGKGKECRVHPAFLLYWCRFGFLYRTKQACLLVCFKKRNSQCACVSQATCQSFREQHKIKQVL